MRWRCDVMLILVATLRDAVHKQQHAAVYAALLPSRVCMLFSSQFYETLRQNGAETQK